MDQNINSFMILNRPGTTSLDRIYYLLEDGCFQQAEFDESSLAFVNQLSMGHAPAVFHISHNSFDKRLLLLLQIDSALVNGISLNCRFILLMNQQQDWQWVLQHQ